MEFKDKLKSLRKERGLSQQALADAIFISRSAVAKWENGLGLPNDESMNALLNYFDVPKEYFATDEPEKVLMKKNQLIRRMAFALTLSVTILSTVFVSLFAMLLISIPVVNDLTAAQVKNRLEGLPLPENSMQVDSLSKAGKMTGNGNGMQYLGAILVESDLSLGEMKSHYAQFRANRWDCLVEVYHGGPLECVDIGNVQFHAELDSSKNYYVVYSWGSGLDFYEDWDLRGH